MLCAVIQKDICQKETVCLRGNKASTSNLSERLLLNSHLLEMCVCELAWAFMDNIWGLQEPDCLIDFKASGRNVKD